jgi:hypothetical protein
VNENEATSSRKPYFVSEAEWAESLRASRTGAFRYIFLSRRVLTGLPAIFLGAFCYQLYAAHWDVPLAFTATVRSGNFIGFFVFLLFIGVTGALDWRGKRQLVFRKSCAESRGSIT